MKFTDYEIEYIKMMLIAGLGGKEIAKERNCTSGFVSAIKTGRLCKHRGNVEKFITISVPTEKTRHRKEWPQGTVFSTDGKCEGLTWAKLPRFSSSPCIVCGKLIWDGPQASSIYMVADDALVCKKNCEKKSLQANE